jgi:hypothetical protein
MRVRGAKLVYVDLESGEESTIAAVDYADVGKERPPNFPLYVTEDRVQAERWRSLVAAGDWPDDLPRPIIVRNDFERLFDDWIRSGGRIPDF